MRVRSVVQCTCAYLVHAFGASFLKWKMSRSRGLHDVSEGTYTRERGPFLRSSSLSSAGQSAQPLLQVMTRAAGASRARRACGRRYSFPNTSASLPRLREGLASGTHHPSPASVPYDDHKLGLPLAFAPISPQYSVYSSPPSPCGATLPWISQALSV